MPVSAPGPQRGGSLVEVLISVLVLCVGLLGLAGTQGASLVTQRSAELHLNAMRLAEAYAESVRIDPVRARAGGFDWKEPYASGLLPLDPGCVLASGCTEGEVPVQLLRAWLATVRDTLPGGDAFVQTAADSQSLLVWVMWKESAAIDRVSTAPACSADAVGKLAEAARPSCVLLRVHL